MLLSEFSFPIYTIRPYNSIYEEEGILYIDTFTGIYILDNKNLEGATVGMRRVKMLKEKLYSFKHTILTIEDFIKLIQGKKTYCMDSTGLVFLYKAAKKYFVKCYTIINRVYRGESYYIEVRGINKLFKCSSSTVGDYARILLYNDGYILLDVLEERFNTTWKRI